MTTTEAMGWIFDDLMNRHTLCSCVVGGGNNGGRRFHWTKRWQREVSPEAVINNELSVIINHIE